MDSIVLYKQLQTLLNLEEDAYLTWKLAMSHVFRRTFISSWRKRASHPEPGTAFSGRMKYGQFTSTPLQAGLLYSFLMWRSRDRWTAFSAASGLSCVSSQHFACSSPRISEPGHSLRWKSHVGNSMEKTPLVTKIPQPLKIQNSIRLT